MTSALFASVLSAACNLPCAVTGRARDSIDGYFYDIDMSNPASNSYLCTSVHDGIRLELTIETIKEICADIITTSTCRTHSMFGPEGGWRLSDLVQILAKYMLVTVARQVFDKVTSSVDVFIDLADDKHVLPVDELRAPQLVSVHLFGCLLAELAKDEQNEDAIDAAAQQVLQRKLLSAITWGTSNERPVLVLPSLSYLPIAYTAPRYQHDATSTLVSRELAISNLVDVLPRTIPTGLEHIKDACPELDHAVLNKVFAEADDTFWARFAAIYASTSSAVSLRNALASKPSTPPVRVLVAKVFGVNAR